MTKVKLHTTQKAASLYADHYPELVTDKGRRIDLLTLTLRRGSGQAIDEKDYDIKHYENI